MGTLRVFIESCMMNLTGCVVTALLVRVFSFNDPVINHILPASEQRPTACKLKPRKRSSSRYVLPGYLDYKLYMSGQPFLDDHLLQRWRMVF